MNSVFLLTSKSSASACGTKQSTAALITSRGALSARANRPRRASFTMSYPMQPAPKSCSRIVSQNSSQPRVPSAEAAEMRDAIPAMGSDAPKGVPIRDLLVLVASLNLCVLVQQLPRMLPRPCLSRLLRRSGVHCTQSSHRLGTGFLAPCRPF